MLAFISHMKFAVVNVTIEVFFLSNIDGSLCSLSVLVGYCTMGTLYVCVSLFDRCLRKVRILCRLSIDVVVFRGQQKRAKNIMCVHVSKWQFEASKHFPFDVCVCVQKDRQQML